MNIINKNIEQNRKFLLQFSLTNWVFKKFKKSEKNKKITIVIFHIQIKHLRNNVVIFYSSTLKLQY